MNTFVERIKDSAVAAQKKYGVFARLTIAQAILETGWGRYSVAQGQISTTKCGHYYDTAR